MAELLSSCHDFVQPSFLDNSPNSLAEAMIVGIPSVSSFVGGVPSMVTDGLSSLMFPAGDELLLAHQIMRLLDNDSLCCSLSENARRIAIYRHDPISILKRQIEIYRKLL